MIYSHFELTSTLLIRSVILSPTVSSSLILELLFILWLVESRKNSMPQNMDKNLVIYPPPSPYSLSVIHSPPPPLHHSTHQYLSSQTRKSFLGTTGLVSHADIRLPSCFIHYITASNAHTAH